jgi:hypothetical protein
MDLHQIDGKYCDLTIITIIRCIVLINKLTSVKVVLNSRSYRKGNLGSTPTLLLEVGLRPQNAISIFRAPCGIILNTFKVKIFLVEVGLRPQNAI